MPSTACHDEAPTIPTELRPCQTWHSCRRRFSMSAACMVTSMPCLRSMLCGEYKSGWSVALGVAVRPRLCWNGCAVPEPNMSMCSNGNSNERNWSPAPSVSGRAKGSRHMYCFSELLHVDAELCTETRGKDRTMSKNKGIRRDSLRNNGTIRLTQMNQSTSGLSFPISCWLISMT